MKENTKELFLMLSFFAVVLLVTGFVVYHVYTNPPFSDYDICVINGNSIKLCEEVFPPNAE